jgi:hypothetical protein
MASLMYFLPEDEPPLYSESEQELARARLEIMARHSAELLKQLTLGQRRAWLGGVLLELDHWLEQRQIL